MALRTTPARNTMTMPKNTVQTKKSPGWEKRDDSVSSPLPYRYRKYGSRRILRPGPVTRKADTILHICGGMILYVKTNRVTQTNFIRSTMRVWPRAERTTAPAVMVLETGGNVQKTSAMMPVELQRVYL